MKSKVTVIGGDKRFSYLKDFLKAKYTVLEEIKSTTELNIRNIKRSDIVILPYPCSFDNVNINAPSLDIPLPITMVFDLLSSSQVLFVGGDISDGPPCPCTRVINYAASESLLLKNAELTAVGLLKTAIEEMEQSMFESKIAITGYGRVGKATLRIFNAVGAKTSVFLRNASDLKLLKESGVDAHFYDDFEYMSPSFDCLINTVPTKVISAHEISKINPECLLIEAASKPYGIDFAAADRHGLRTIIAGSLPGKTSPLTAAKIIYETIGELI